MTYSDKVIDHVRHPRNVGSLDERCEGVGTGIASEPECGDVVKLQIEVDNGMIRDARFRTFGCGSAIAASSLTTEWLKGRSVEQAGQLKHTEIAAELSLPVAKIHCSVLAEEAVRAAIADWKSKHGLSARA